MVKHKWRGPSAAKLTKKKRSIDNALHQWRVGEVCTAVYDNLGEGLIYRVTDVTIRSEGGEALLKVTPVFGVIADPSGRKPRQLSARYCTPLSLIDLATMYAKFGLWIAEEAKNRGDEQQETDSETVPAGDDGVDEGRSEDGNDCGLFDGAA